MRHSIIFQYTLLIQLGHLMRKDGLENLALTGKD